VLEIIEGDLSKSFTKIFTIKISFNNQAIILTLLNKKCDTQFLWPNLEQFLLEDLVEFAAAAWVIIYEKQ